MFAWLVGWEIRKKRSGKVGRPGPGFCAAEDQLFGAEADDS